MKIVITSDIHLGDNYSRLAPRKTYPDKWEFTETFETFAKLLKKGGEQPEYLVLNGDILDFSISSYKKAFTIARAFFQKIKEENLAKQIIYIPGNHDKHIWDAVDWEVSVIRRLKAHKHPKGLKRTQPGYIDLSSNSKEKKLVLPGVRYVDNTEHYGDLFLEGLFKEEDKKIPINIVYPNLYIKTDAHTYIVTHGHLLDMPWVLLSELLEGWEGINCSRIRNFEKYNYPLTSMICTSIGQGGKVSNSVYNIMNEIKNEKKTENLEKMILHMLTQLKKSTEIPCYLSSKKINSLIIQWLVRYFGSKVKNPRYNEEYYEEIQNDIYKRERFIRFYNACVNETREWALPHPDSIIFGHTHVSIPQKELTISNKGKDLKINIYNTGGWLSERDKNNNALLLFLCNKDGVVPAGPI